MGILLTKMIDRIENLKREFKSNRLVKHQGVKGGLNETELSELLKDVVPKKYGFTKGVIENSEGEQSNESDIIVYDDEILPAYIKSDLSFVPLEAVSYVFEVKSKLNSAELKTTIEKFLNYKKMGGNAPTILFAYSTDCIGSEISRYYKNDNNFFTAPAITAICIPDKCYYYKSTEEFYLKDIYTKEEWLKMVTGAVEIDIDEVLDAAEKSFFNDDALNNMSRHEFAQSIHNMINLKEHKRSLGKKGIAFNGIEFDDIKFKIHSWVMLVADEQSDTDYAFLSFLSGVSNTLSVGNFGNYLLSNKVGLGEVCAVCYEDMWGNLSGKDFNEEGLSYNVNEFSFSYHSNSDENKHEMIFEAKR